MVIHLWHFLQAWKNDKSTDEAKYTVQFWVPPFLPVVPGDS